MQNHPPIDSHSCASLKCLSSYPPATGSSTFIKAQRYSRKTMTRRNCDNLLPVTPLGSNSAGYTKSVFISQKGTHSSCEWPAIVFDKQGRQGCGRVPGKVAFLTTSHWKHKHTCTQTHTDSTAAISNLK